MKNFLTRKNTQLILLAILVLVFFSACSNAENVEACRDGKTYGFWNGLWHGIIAPIDLVGMLFRDDVSVFAVNNNGAWYSFGFLIGSGGWGILGGRSMGKSRD
jgi:hypothetical protein